MSLFQACKNLSGGDSNAYSTTASGLEYKIYTQNEEGSYERKEDAVVTDTAQLATKVGQIMTLQMEYRNSEDSVLFSTYERNMPVQIEMMRSPIKGGIEEAFLMLTPGDSGVFKINADSLFTKTFQQPRPPFIKEGSDLVFNIKALKLQPREAAMAEQETMMKQRYDEQMKTDDEKIKAYLAEKGLEAEKTGSGVYYVITKKGQGDSAEVGKTVSVTYTGTFLDGNVFDSTEKNGGQPFEFPLGRGAVIPGWDEGIAQLREGDEAILLVPSPLAYGDMGRGADMPANSVLRFDVQLLDVKE